MNDESKQSQLITYPELVDALSKQLKTPRKTVKTVIEGMVAMATEEMKKGNKVQIKGLGNLVVKDRPAGKKAQQENTDAKRGKRAMLAPAPKLKSMIGL